MSTQFKNHSLGVPEHSGERITNETGDTFTGVYEFKDEEREPFFRLHDISQDRLPDKEVKTAWHSAMQARFLRQDDKFKHEQHYTAKEGTQRRQADLIYDDRTVVELQHSGISMKDLKARTEDALETYDKIIWIFDFEQMKAKLFQTDFLFEDHLDRKILKALTYKQQQWVDREGGIQSTRLPPNVREQYFGYKEWIDKYSSSYGWTEGYMSYLNWAPVIATALVAIPDNSVLRVRHTSPPVWAHLLTEKNDWVSPENTLIKQYSDYEEFDDEVEVWFHDQNQEYEYFFKIEKSFSRGHGKTYAADLQKRMPYMLELSTKSWEQLVETVKNG